MSALRLAARLICVLLLAASASAQEPGPHAIVRIHSLDPDRPGDEPVGLVMVRGGTEFAVLHRDSSDLSFHRTSDGVFLARVELGGLPSRAAATLDGAKIIVVDRTLDQAIVVDAAARSIEARIALPTVQPLDVLITPNGRQAVIIPAWSTTSSALTLVDLVTNSVAGSILIPSGGAAESWSNDVAALSGDGSQLLLLGDPARTVDLVSGSVRWTAPTGFTHAVAGWLNPAGDRGLIVTSGPGHGKFLWSIDIAQGTETQIGVIVNNESATRLIVTEDGRHAVFGSAGGLLFADLLLGTTTLVSGVRGDAIATTLDGETIAVNDFEDQVAFDVRTATEIARFPTSWVTPTRSRGIGGGRVVIVDEGLERAAMLDLNPVAPDVPWTRATGQGIEFDGVSSAHLAAGGALVGVTSTASWNVVFQDPTTGRSAGSLEFQRPILDAAIGGGVAVVKLGLPACSGPGELEVWKIDGSSKMGTIPVGYCSHVLAVARSGDFAVAADRPVLGPGGLPYDLIVFDTADPLGGTGYRVTLPVEVFPYLAVLSPGGRWLAMPGSSASEWYLFDLALGRVVQSFVPSDREAIAFSEDDQRLFVGSNVPDHAVSEIDLSLMIPTEIARHLLPPGVSRPIDVEVDGRGERVWATGLSGLGFFERSAPGAFTWLITSTGYDFLRVLGPHAIITRAGRYRRFFVREAGPSIELVESVNNAAIPAPFFAMGPLLDRQRGLLTWADQSSDGLFVLDLGSTRSVDHCGGAPGAPLLTATGPFVAHGTSFELAASGVPPATFGFPLIGTGAGTLPLGNGVCIGPPLRRWTARLNTADASGVLRLRVLPNELPIGTGPGVDHGEAWRFQVWFRSGGTPGLGQLTNAVEVYFR